MKTVTEKNRETLQIEKARTLYNRKYIENKHETPRRKIDPRNRSYASTTDYGKKIFVGGDIHIKRISKETFNSSF